MKHINHDDRTRAERTPAEWLRVGASIAKVANKWANRDDLVVFVGEGAAEGVAAALFKPAIAEIEISTKQAFGFGVSPESIGDFEERSTRYEFPKATGAILHEAFHARFSRWSIEKAREDLAADEFTALMLLEEGRIERQGLDFDPNYRLFLRSCAMELVLGELSEEALDRLTVESAAQIVGLLNARVVAGIFEADEVADVTQAVRLHLGEKAFVRMLEIIDEYQQHTNHYVIDSSYNLAIEWARIIRELKEEKGEEGQGEGGEGEGGEGEGGFAEILKAIRDAAEEMEISNNLDLADQQESEEWKEQTKERADAAKEAAKAKQTAKEVFDKTTGAECGGTRSVLEEKRLPLGKERAAAVTVARLLEQAKYRDRDLTIVHSSLPQGRLRAGAALQNAALKAQGMMSQGNEWKRKQRKQTDEPTLRVGVMVDISGSMREAMQPMATTAWVMSEAVKRVQGKCAMVYYGNDVFPTLKPGQHLDAVRVYTANDGTEKFDKAFKALDGSLNLLHGSGARLLVIVSDGIYTNEEAEYARQWLKRCEQEGVAVLWLTFKDNAYRREGAEVIAKGSHAVVLSGCLDPADAAVEIGKAAARALEITNAALAA